MVKWFPQRLDRVASVLILLLGIPLGLLLYGGDTTAPKVRTFSWQNASIGAADTAFILTFNRPMNWESVAANLQITPQLPGKFSASGRRFVYTLHQPIPYGQTFRLEVNGATDKVLGRSQQTQRVMQPFVGTFRSRDRAFVYIGVGGSEDGRLILQNLSRQQRTLLTPSHWVVMRVKPYPEGDRLLVSAVERRNAQRGSFEQNLYSVATGLGTEPAGTLQPLVNNTEAQILKFDLSANGRTIVLQRYPRSKREPVGLWALEHNQPLRLITQAAAGEFSVTPDGLAVAIAQNQGISIVPIPPGADRSAIEYLPQLGMTISFAQDATAATMMKFNPNGTRSLFLVTSQGIQKELLNTNGYILKAQFDAQNQRIFCLYTRLPKGQNLGSTLHISAIDRSTLKRSDFVQLSGQTSGHMSLAPDGSELLFDVVKVAEQSAASVLTNEIGQPITQSILWRFPLRPSTSPNPLSKKSALSISGIQPNWIP